MLPCLIGKGCWGCTQITCRYWNRVLTMTASSEDSLFSPFIQSWKSIEEDFSLQTKNSSWKLCSLVHFYYSEKDARTEHQSVINQQIIRRSLSAKTALSEHISCNKLLQFYMCKSLFYWPNKLIWADYNVMWAMRPFPLPRLLFCKSCSVLLDWISCKGLESDFLRHSKGWNHMRFLKSLVLSMPLYAPLTESNSS